MNKKKDLKENKKIKTMIDSIYQSIKEEYITLEELKYIIKQVELRLERRK